MLKFWTVETILQDLIRQLECKEHRRKGCLKCWPKGWSKVLGWLLVLHISASFASAPANLKVRVQADEGVGVAVEIDGSDFYRYSGEARNGIRTHYFDFHDIPAGEYIVSAYEIDPQGNNIRALSATFKVVE